MGALGEVKAARSAGGQRRDSHRQARWTWTLKGHSCAVSSPQSRAEAHPKFWPGRKLPAARARPGPVLLRPDPDCKEGYLVMGRRAGSTPRRLRHSEDVRLHDIDGGAQTAHHSQRAPAYRRWRAICPGRQRDRRSYALWTGLGAEPPVGCEASATTVAAVKTANTAASLDRGKGNRRIWPDPNAAMLGQHSVAPRWSRR